MAERQIKLVYIAGPYRADTEDGVFRNIMAARDAAVQVWKLGAVALCPHLNSMLMGGVVPDERFLDGGLELVGLCDAMLVLPSSSVSQGTAMECRAAQRLGLPVFTTVGGVADWLQHEEPSDA